MKRSPGMMTWHIAIEIGLWHRGWGLPLAAALIVVAAAILLGGVLPGRIVLELLILEPVTPRRRNDAHADVEKQQENQRRGDSLRNLLRQAANDNAGVEKIAALSQSEQVPWTQGDYATKLHSSVNVNQLQVSQAATLTYPQLRRYVDAVLHAMPNVSLDQISVRRDHVAQPKIDAQLKWSLWTQATRPSPDLPSRRTTGDLFATRAWAPPPRTEQQTVPAAPSIPPLPFSFLGRKMEARMWEVYLVRGDQTYVAREGSVLESLWRIDKITPTSLAVTYLPGGVIQTMPLGEFQ